MFDKYFLMIYFLSLLFYDKVLSQTICYNPTTNCFDPLSTQSILFQYGQYTTCSRVSPITQLNCFDGNTQDSVGLCTKYSKLISTIKCTNSGFDASKSVIWKCDGNLPTGIMFGTTTVSCEGCISSSDKLKITGSCGIFYQLLKKPNLQNPSDSSSSLSDKSTYTNKYTNGFIIFICFLSGSIIIICLIKLCVRETDYVHEIFSGSNNRAKTRSRSRNSYVTITSPEKVIIPETIPLTTGYPVKSNISQNPPPINPDYQSVLGYTATNQYQQTNKYQTRPQVYPRQPVQVEMTTQYVTKPQSQPYAQQNDTSNFLSGYLVGKNLQEGNIGSAYLASTITGGGNNYSSGMALGIIEGSSHSHKSHHKKKHHHNYEKNNDLVSNKISFESNEIYANSNTR